MDMDGSDHEDDTVPLSEQIHDFNMHVIKNEVVEMDHLINHSPFRYNVDNVDYRGDTALHVAARN